MQKVGSASGAIAAGAIFVLLYSLTRKAVAGGNLMYYQDGLHALNFDGATPVLTLRLRVQNTSNQSFTLYSLSADVNCNNTLIGNASFFTPQIIPANGQVILLINVRLFMITLVQDLINAFQQRNFKFTLNLKGTSNVDNIQYPLDLTYNIGV